MSVKTILPIKGVPNELIETLNDRFRNLGGSTAINADGSTAGHYFTHANRRDANSTTVGTYGTETDRGVTYQVRTVGSSQVWVYAYGVMQADLANEPSDLGSNDIGFLWDVTDFAHLLRWTAAGWEFADEEGGYIVGRITAPGGHGWQVCDGTITSYLQISGGVVAAVPHTTQDLTTGVYTKFSGSFGAVTAATAPGTTKSGSASVGTAFVATVDATGQPRHVDLIPYFRR